MRKKTEINPVSIRLTQKLIYPPCKVPPLELEWVENIYLLPREWADITYIFV
jgi:hypothetical protein